MWLYHETEGVHCLSGPGAVGQPFSLWTPGTSSSWSGPWLIQSDSESEREIKRYAIASDDWLIGVKVTVAALAACLVVGTRRCPCNWARGRELPGTERKRRQLSTPLLFLSLSYCPSEKWKAGGTGRCSESITRATGVLTGVVRGVLLEGCGLVSASAKGFSWDWEEEDEEWVLSLELLRVSVLVLVFFIFLLFASGALSTVCRRKPSRLHLLNA